MEELFAVIEKKIKESGFSGNISGEEIYDDICDQIDEQENGSYILLSKFQDDIILEYRITVMDDNFNLEKITIKTSEGEYEAEFDL